MEKSEFEPAGSGEPESGDRTAEVPEERPAAAPTQRPSYEWKTTASAKSPDSQVSRRDVLVGLAGLAVGAATLGAGPLIANHEAKEREKKYRELREQREKYEREFSVEAPATVIASRRQPGRTQMVTTAATLNPLLWFQGPVANKRVPEAFFLTLQVDSKEPTKPVEIKVSEKTFNDLQPGERLHCRYLTEPTGTRILKYWQ